MQSMTGFGRARIERNGVRVETEIKSLNQRFFELKLNLPRGWAAHEAEIRKQVQAAVARGRVEVMVRRVTLKAPPARLIVNHGLVAQYLKEVETIGKRMGINGKSTLDAILQRPEIFQIVEDDREADADVKLAFQAMARAIKILIADRAREGKSLKRDLAERLARIEAGRREITKLAEESRAAIVASFQGRVKELLAELPLDERRLYEEASIAAQRADVSEELTRLAAHLKGLGELLARPGAVGKPIEFLLQEVNREVNTIGSKSQNAALSRVAVTLKGELEKMREQVQNVE